MKIGRIFAGGLISVSLAAFAVPSWANTPSATSSRFVATSSATQIAFDDDAVEHHESREHDEKIEHGGDRLERHMHSDSDEEHGGTRNMVREHAPGTEEHEEHEEREGEEHHTVHHSDLGY